jgi:hypothetical protein
VTCHEVRGTADLSVNKAWRASCFTSAVRSLIIASFLLSGLAAASGCSSSTSPKGSDAASTGGPSGTPGVNPPTALSGTRLHAKSITGGGARAVVAFHDMERDEDCTFQPAESGRTRCFPAVLQAYQSGTFSDAACQIPVGIAAATCSSDVKYAMTVDTPNCGSGTPKELRKVLATGPSYGLTPSGCAQVTPPKGATATVPLGEVVPWTAFVEATETVVAGSPVSEKVLVAADGSRQHLAYRDDKLNVDCTFRLMADGITRCVASASEGPVMYGDEACTKALVVNDYSQPGYPGGCTTAGQTAANLWLEPSPRQCGGLSNVYSLRQYEGTSDGASLFAIPNDGESQSGGLVDTSTCRSSGTLRSNGSYVRAIAQNLTLSLPTTARVSPGGDRLRPALVLPPTLETLVPGWHDTMNDVDCVFTLATDGKTRCLPVAAQAAILFTDDACKSPSRVAVLTEPSCIGVPRFARVVSTTCPPTTRIFALGTATRDLSGVSLATTSGQCALVAQAKGALDATEVDPAQFVEGVTAIE